MPDKRYNRSFFLGFLVMMIGGLWLTGCGSDDTTKPNLTVGTCEGCHQNADMLKASMEPEGEPIEGDPPGEG